MGQTIKCKVHDCKYCDYKKDICMLKEINIVNGITGNTPKELTMCESYKAKKS